MFGVAEQFHVDKVEDFVRCKKACFRLAFPSRIKVWDCIEKDPFFDRFPKGSDYVHSDRVLFFDYTKMKFADIRGDVDESTFDRLYHAIEDLLPLSVFPLFSKELHGAISDIFLNQLYCYASLVNQEITEAQRHVIDEELRFKAKISIHHERCICDPLQFPYPLKLSIIQPRLRGSVHGCISEFQEGRDICVFLQSRALKSCMGVLERIFNRFSMALLQGEEKKSIDHYDKVFETMFLTFFRSQSKSCILRPSLYVDLYRMISCIHRYEKSKLSLSEAFQFTDNSFLKCLSVDKAWELFIDSERSSRYCYLFDIGGDDNRKNVIMEFGYISSLMETFAFYLPTKDNPVKLTSEFLILLHDAAITGVYLEGKEKRSLGGFVDFNLCVSNSTPKGLEELEKKISCSDGIFKDWSKVTDICPNGLFSRSYERTVKTVEACKVMLNRIIQLYEEEMMVATSSENRKMAMVRFAQNLDQAHVFSDGNIRTCVLVLNFLLIQNDEPPVLWLDPNILDGFSLEEACTVVREGQERFLTLIESNVSG